MSAILLPDGLLLHYEVLGRGRPPVLFLHSWFGSWRYWLLSMEEAALRHRAYAMDLPGFGGSTNLDQGTIPFQVEQAQEAVVRFLDLLGIDHFIVVGHGLGSLLALELAWKFPDQVEKVLTIALPWNGAPLARWLKATPQQMASRLFVGPPSEEIQVARDEIAHTPLESFRESLAWSQAFWDAPPQPLRQPWLLLYGEQDPLVPPPDENAQSHLPPAPQRHLLVIPKAAHFPMLEHPRMFHRLLRAFLQMAPDDDITQLRLHEEWQRRVR